MSTFGKKPPSKPTASNKTETMGRQQTAKRPALTKEDKLKEMIEQDPEKAAALLRQMFLNK